MALYMTASQLEKTCRLWRQVQPKQGSRDRDATSRWVRYRESDEGMVVIEAHLHPEEAATVMKAIESSAETSDEWSCDRADGLVAAAELALGARQEGPVRAPVEVTMTICAATLEGHSEGGLGLSAQAARRLCCDAGISPVIVDEAGTPLDAGRKTRTVPAAMRRALALRDDGCRFPGCSNRRFLDAHHIEHWADGGETTLANTLEICRSHHRFVHEYGYRVQVDADGRIEFFDPRGRLLTGAGSGATVADGWGAVRDTVRAAGLSISAETNMPLWDGEPVDYECCIDDLVSCIRA
jgi:hypothetical protein